MVVYGVFAKWKTRRALARGVSLAALLGLVWYGIDRQIEGGIGDLGRCAGAGLVGISTALVDYGNRDREQRVPRTMVFLVFLVAWLSLVVVFLVPSFFTVLNGVVEDPAAAGRALLSRIGRVGAPLTLPAAIVFTLVTRARWRRETFRGRYVQAAGTVTVLGAILGLGVIASGQTPAVHPFHFLVTAPLLFVFLLPPVAHTVDRIDGWLFPLPDDPTIGPSGQEEESGPANAARPKRRKIWDTGSSDRVFSWGDNEEDEPDGEQAGKAAQGESGELDAIAGDLWDE